MAERLTGTALCSGGSPHGYARFGLACRGDLRPLAERRWLASPSKLDSGISTLGMLHGATILALLPSGACSGPAKLDILIAAGYQAVWLRPPPTHYFASFQSVTSLLTPTCVREDHFAAMLFEIV